MITEHSKQRLISLLKVFEGWLNDRSYKDGWYGKRLMYVNVKQCWWRYPHQVIDELKQLVNAQKAPFTMEWVEWLEENLTDGIVNEIRDNYLEYEGRYLVEDWPMCWAEKDDLWWATKVDSEIAGLYGRSGGQYCYAESPLDEVQDLLYRLDDISDIDEEGHDVEIEDIIQSTRGVWDNIRAFEVIENWVTSMSKGLEDNFIDEVIYHTWEEPWCTLDEFISEDTELEEKLAAITH